MPQNKRSQKNQQAKSAQSAAIQHFNAKNPKTCIPQRGKGLRGDKGLRVSSSGTSRGMDGEGGEGGTESKNE